MLSFSPIRDNVFSKRCTFRSIMPEYTCMLHKHNHKTGEHNKHIKRKKREESKKKIRVQLFFQDF